MRPGSDEIYRIAHAHGVDLIGIAPVDSIELGHPARPAEDLLPGARTSITFAASLLWGALNCPRGTKGAVKDTQLAYERIEGASAAVGRFLESRGEASYIIPASLPVDTIRHNGASYYAAEWSHRQAAIAAGLGVKGLNNLLITPEFGPYIRLGGILTRAEIPTTRRELPDDPCSRCEKCIKACPVGALNPDPDAVPRLNQAKCKSRYIRPFLHETRWKTIKSLFTTPGIGSLGVQVVMEGYYFSCAECMRVCTKGRLEARQGGGGDSGRPGGLPAQ